MVEVGSATFPAHTDLVGAMAHPLRGVGLSLGNKGE